MNGPAPEQRESLRHRALSSYHASYIYLRCFGCVVAGLPLSLSLSLSLWCMLARCARVRVRAQQKRLDL